MNVDFEVAPSEFPPLVEVVEYVIFPYVIARDCTAAWHVPYDVVRQHYADSFDITAGVEAAEGLVEVPDEARIRVHAKPRSMLLPTVPRASSP